MSGQTQELIQICEQLPDAERAELADFARFLLVKHQQQNGSSALHASPLADAIIRHTNGVAGGDACVRDTRVPVWTLVQLKKLGRSEQQLIADFPGITQDDLDAVWVYYRAPTDEIEKAIAAEAAED